jgi:F-type H+-transporting ATPase subunit delta
MPKYTAKQYAAALFDSLQEKGAKTDAVVKSFAKILVANYDRALLPKIAMQLAKLERATLGRHDVVLTSARPLTTGVISEIKKKVGENSGITEVVDPSVLGGLKILINDELVIDGTVKGRIERMKQQLLKVAE